MGIVVASVDLKHSTEQSTPCWYVDVCEVLGNPYWYRIWLRARGNAVIQEVANLEVAVLEPSVVDTVDGLIIELEA